MAIDTGKLSLSCAAGMAGLLLAAASLAARSKRNPAGKDAVEYYNSRTRAKQRDAALGAETPQAYVTEVYSLCTDDCEGRYHVPDFKKCDRCGANIHKLIIELEHPEQGFMTVGSECVKDLMGFKWSLSHEQAWANHLAFEAFLKEFGLPYGVFSKGGGAIARHRTFRTDADFLEWNRMKPLMEKELSIHGIQSAFYRDPLYKLELPHPMADRVVLAAQDMGLPWVRVCRSYHKDVVVRRRDVPFEGFRWLAILDSAEDAVKVIGGTASNPREARELSRKAALEIAAPHQYPPKTVYSLVFTEQEDLGDKCSGFKILFEPVFCAKWNTYTRKAYGE